MDNFSELIKNAIAEGDFLETAMREAAIVIALVKEKWTQAERLLVVPPYLFRTMAGSLGLQYRSLYWAGVR